MRVKSIFVPIIVISALVGSVLLASAAGAWTVTGRSAVDLGALAPVDIKGWMTLQQVIDGVPIAKEELYGLINIPGDIPTTTALKDLEKLVEGFETSAVRDALTARQVPTAVPQGK
jgi:hypothetical protein